MVLASQSAVRLADLLFTCRVRDSEDLIVVALRHSSSRTPSPHWLLPVYFLSLLLSRFIRRELQVTVAWDAGPYNASARRQTWLRLRRGSWKMCATPCGMGTSSVVTRCVCSTRHSRMSRSIV